MRDTSDLQILDVAAQRGQQAMAVPDALVGSTIGAPAVGHAGHLGGLGLHQLLTHDRVRVVDQINAIAGKKFIQKLEQGQRCVLLKVFGKR